MVFGELWGNRGRHPRQDPEAPLSVGKFKDESGYVAVYIDDL
eukprot:SAG11_NODE_20967_length_434_cov_1.913433_1_plen_41_part_01